jgi:hypothetical protein
MLMYHQLAWETSGLHLWENIHTGSLIIRILNLRSHALQAVKDSTSLAQGNKTEAPGADEAAAVLEYFNRTMAGAQGRAGVRVKRIERVQNWRLWTKYIICRRYLGA